MRTDGNEITVELLQVVGNMITESINPNIISDIDPIKKIKIKKIKITIKKE